jgi:hypothetical protein
MVKEDKNFRFVANLAICNIMEYVYTKELKART